MKELPYPSLLDADYSLEGNNKAFNDMPNVVQMLQGQTQSQSNPNVNIASIKGELDHMFEDMVTDNPDIDGYYLYGELVNQFIQAFPEMKDAWGKLSTDQKWIFIEGLHYGCGTNVRSHMGFKQVC